MTTKQKRVRYVSPPGIAIWPRLNEPDTKFDADGQFTAKLAMEEGEERTQEFVRKLEGIRDEAFKAWASENPKKAKSKSSPPKIVPVFRTEEDDEGDETGRITFNFKMKHKVTAKATKKVYYLRPQILNGRKETLKNPPNIGGGSTLKVSFEVNPYFNEKDKEFGLSLRLVAVMILKLVEFGQGSAGNDFGDEDEDEFEDIQDGEAKPDKDDDSDDDSDDEDGDEDF